MLGTKRKLGVVATLAVAAFGTTFVGSANAQGLEAEVSHRWTSEQESQAINVLASAFSAAGGVWLDRGVAPAEAQEQDAISRIVAGQPYHVVNFNIGAPPLDELVANGVMRSIDDQTAGWIDGVSEAVRSAISYPDGHVYMIPLSLQSNVVLYTNLRVLKEHGIEEPTNWDEFFAAADKLKAEGVIPVAFGGQAFQERITFYGLVGWVGGADLVGQIFDDHSVEAVRSPEFRQAVEIFNRLHDYVDEGQSGRAWDVTTNLIASDQAAFRIMGDFAKSVLTGAGMEPMVDFSCRFGPQDNVQFLYGNALAFPIMHDEEDTAAQNLFIQAVMAPDVQVEFAKLKGGMPARFDVDTSGFDVCTQHSLKAMATPGQTVAWPLIAMDPDVEGRQNDLIHHFWGDPSLGVDAFIDEFAETVELSK